MSLLLKNRLKFKNQTGQTTTIRQTILYSLVKGYGPTENMYFILRRKTINVSIGASTWFPEIQANALIKLTDDEFDIACSKFDYL